MEHIYNALTVLSKKSKMVSFTSLVMKIIVMFPSPSRFSGKLICSITFGSASSAYFLLKTIAITL